MQLKGTCSGLLRNWQAAAGRSVTEHQHLLIETQIPAKGNRKIQHLTSHFDFSKQYLQIYTDLGATEKIWWKQEKLLGRASAKAYRAFERSGGLCTIATAGGKPWCCLRSRSGVLFGEGPTSGGPVTQQWPHQVEEAKGVIKLQGSPGLCPSSVSLDLARHTFVHEILKLWRHSQQKWHSTLTTVSSWTIKHRKLNEAEGQGPG